jgi:hypothetical protein
MLTIRIGQSQSYPHALVNGHVSSTLVHHHSSGEANDRKQTVEPLMNKYNVNVVICGHDHNGLTRWQEELSIRPPRRPSISHWVPVVITKGMQQRTYIPFGPD